LIRGLTTCAWAVHADTPEDLARRVDLLAADERPLLYPEQAPLHEQEYLSLLGGAVQSGPAFEFSELGPSDPDVRGVDHAEQLARHFRGWVAEELPARAPIVAIFEGGDAISVCFCARRSTAAAEAGLETAKPFRGRGFGPRVATVWAIAVRASGLLPIYSTSWRNSASLSVARKLGLHMCANDWNLLPLAG
jgi:hypothetical protein